MSHTPILLPARAKSVIKIKADKVNVDIETPKGSCLVAGVNLALSQCGQPHVGPKPCWQILSDQGHPDDFDAFYLNGRKASSF